MQGIGGAILSGVDPFPWLVRRASSGQTVCRDGIIHACRNRRPENPSRRRTWTGTPRISRLDLQMDQNIVKDGMASNANIRCDGVGNVSILSVPFEGDLFRMAMRGFL